MIAEYIPALKHLWQEAFGDPVSVIDAFFATGFSADRCHLLLEDGEPVSGLYWFDCQLEGSKLAYLYAVATRISHRGKGLGTRLMEETHRTLRDRGYAGCILVPDGQALRAWYSSLGYRTVTTVGKFRCHAGSTPVPLREITAAEYAQLRKTHLPVGGVVQEGVALDYLQALEQFYAGDNWLLAASIENSTLIAQEFWGNPQAAPAILRALHCEEGRFRGPGAGEPFAMFLPLQDNCPIPSYFGLALD